MKKNLSKFLLVFIIFVLQVSYLSNKISGIVETLYLNPIDEMSKIVEVSAGYFHVLAMDDKGNLWAWGNNWAGQLGDGTTEKRLIPVKVMSNVISVSAGEYHSLAIQSDGSLWAWGYNSAGELGNGGNINSSIPIKILENVSSISAGAHHSFAIKNDGSLWGWGSNMVGALGDGTTSDKLTPIKIMDNVSRISAGSYFALAIKTDNSLWAWGHNSSGQLGDGTTENKLFPVKVMSNVESISAGVHHSLAVKSDNTLWVWGNNDRGQLGDGTMISRFVPIKVMDNVSSISAGMFHTSVIDLSKQYWYWGEKSFSGEILTSPVLFSQMSNASALSNGNEYSLVVKTDGSLWGLGRNDNGQLGIGNTIIQKSPIEIVSSVLGYGNKYQFEERFSSVSIGVNHRAVLKENGNLWLWGNNDFGQIGNRDLISAEIPVKVLDSVSSISIVYNQSFAIMNDKSLWAWGYNEYGQLGDGTRENKLVPTKVLEDVILVSGGESHTLAIKSDGSLWAWGLHFFGSSGSSLTPVKIMDNVVYASSGAGKSFVVSNDNNLWAWGNNAGGALGDGTTINKSIPVKILENIDMVSAGYNHTLALNKNGELYSWGDNRQGQLGVSSLSNSTTPVYVMDKVLKINAGNYQSFAIKSDDSLWAWGQQNLGYTESIRSVFSPQKVLDDISMISSWHEKLAITVQGTLMEWSMNYGDFPRRLLIPQQLEITQEMSKINLKTDLMYQFTLSYLPSDYDGTVKYTLNSSVESDQIQFYNHGVIMSSITGQYTLTISNAGEDIIYKIVDLNFYNGIRFKGIRDRGKYYSPNQLFFEYAHSVTHNSEELPSGVIFDKQGVYTIKLIDEIGEVNFLSFSIDLPPIISGVVNNEVTNSDKIVFYNEGTAYLNGVIFLSGGTISEEGKYQLVVSDEGGNSTVVNFEIDKTPPNIDISPYNTEPTSQNITVYAYSSDGILNTSSHTFYENGSFTFIATDLAGNVTEETVTITNIVSPTQVKTISISQLPTKLNYIQGVDLDPTGGQISVITYEGSVSTLPLTLDMLSGYDPYSSVYGPQTVTVTYQGLTTTFEVYLNRFIDVPYGHRNYVHINALVGLGIINGYSDNTFRPSNTLTRAQAAIMIVRAIGLSTEGVSSNFTDVPPTHAAYKFISAAYQAGIINGYSDGTFKPNANVTRAQIAIMVQRAFNVQASETVISFTDVPEGYAPKKFIETLASQKIVNGYSDGTFKPLNNVTRAQFSTMIYNAIQYAQKTE
jgi:alpha-tubulin suppressor-like RCC1 family protein